MMGKLKINLNELSQGKVILNGKDISDKVLGLRITSMAGEIPEIVIKITSGNLIAEIEGKVKEEK